MPRSESQPSTVRVNGAEIYLERAGSGPPVVFVSGATGDAGHWAQVAEVLASANSVITYDRRGNSRSPAPPGWTSTSIEEQADDCIALMRALTDVPATLVGSSGGADIVLSVLERAPDAVRGAVVHEPTLLHLVGADAAAAIGPAISAALDAGGPQSALQLFLSMAFGDHVVASLEPKLRQRMLGNAEVFLGLELAQFTGFDPNIERLSNCGVPIAVAAGRDTRGAPMIGNLYEGASILANKMDTPLREMTGQHVPYLSHPEACARELRDILAGL